MKRYARNKKLEYDSKHPQRPIELLSSANVRKNIQDKNYPPIMFFLPLNNKG